MRLVIIVVVVAVALVLLAPLFRRPGRRTAPADGAVDELVKDPICNTYIVRSRAVSRTAGNGLLYFCSAECARRYPARLHG
jgi:hypothetical protein